MAEDSNVDTAAIIAVLDDEYARLILAATSTEPMSATQLSDTCNASPPTIYRRLDQLKSHNLIIERTRLDPDGNHYAVYAARLRMVAIRLDDGSFYRSDGPPLPDRTRRTACIRGPGSAR